ncbi:hypothetical protein [Arhodomonas sp. AD133]|uniref:hypothetical protein n=1 Tax=Arhodomonas sp. AD133 TaxID=3415009 RepID=UPI003EBED441
MVTAATTSPKRFILAFVAGFLATLVFHQLALAALWAVALAPVAPYSLAATAPFGVPAVFSLAFWGGVWGIVYALVDRWFPYGGGYWLAAFLFGGVFPTLVALLLVAPLKGAAFAVGWNPQVWLMALLINGAWGVGTGVFLRWFSGMHRLAS